MRRHLRVHSSLLNCQEHYDYDYESELVKQ